MMSTNNGNINICELPTELLEYIYNDLLSMRSQLHFSAVCSHWRRIALRNRPANIPHQLPLLVLPSKKGDDETQKSFLSTSNMEIWKLCVPETHRRWLCGSSLGWFMTADETSREMNLVNPFSDWCFIPLPSLDRIPELRYVEFPEFPREEWSVVKFALSSPPPDPNCVVMIIAITMNRLYFHRRGQDGWVPVECTFQQFDDVIYYCGKFYAIGYDGSLVECSLDLTANNFKAIRILPPDPDPHEVGMEDFVERRYLVVSGGELLKISRFIDRADDLGVVADVPNSYVDKKTSS